MELRPHQQKALDNVNEIFAEDNKAIVVHPTGTGKTYIALELFRQNKDKKMVFVSPSSAIIGQLKVSIAKEFGVKPEEYKKVFPNLEITTYQQINSDFKKSETYAQDFDADLVVFDEAHHTAATEWGKNAKALMSSHPETNFLGLTATPQRPDGIDVVKEVFDGNLADEITLEEAVATGLLKMPNYVTALYSYEPLIEELEAGLEAIQDKYPEKYLMLKKDMEKAKNLLEKSHGLPEIFAKHMVKKDGKYIVFCKDIEHLERMVEAAKTQGWFDDVNENVEILAIHSEEDDKTNAKVLKRFRENHVATDNTLRILFSVEKINEGLHLDDIAGEIMLRPTRSKIVYRQQLGRAMSISSSARKGRAVVFDIVDNIDSFDDVKDFIDGVRELGGGHLDGGDLFDDFYLADETREAREALRRIAGELEVEWEDFYQRSVKWREDHDGQAPKSNTKDKNEGNMYRWERTQILKYLKEYQDVEEQEIPEEYREKIKKLKTLGLKYIPIEYKTVEEKFEAWKQWVLENEDRPNSRSSDEKERKIARDMSNALQQIKKQPEKYKSILDEYNTLIKQYGDKVIRRFKKWESWVLEQQITPSRDSQEPKERKIASDMKNAMDTIGKNMKKYGEILQRYNELYTKYNRTKDHKTPIEHFELWKSWVLENKSRPSITSEDKEEIKVASGIKGAVSTMKKETEKYRAELEEYEQLITQYGDRKSIEERFEAWKRWVIKHEMKPSRTSENQEEREVEHDMSNALQLIRKQKEKYQPILDEYEFLSEKYGDRVIQNFVVWKEWTIEHKRTPSRVSKDGYERKVAENMKNARKAIKENPQKYNDVLIEYEELLGLYRASQISRLQEEKEQELEETRQLKTQAEQAETLDAQTQAALDQAIDEQIQKPKGPGE